MPNRLPVPAELEALIEKRETPDRRQDDTPQKSSAAASQRTPEEERRTGEDRRS